MEITMNKVEAYEFLCRTAEGIAKMFGQCCETVVQEYRDNEIETLCIFNGHVSGRSKGSTRSIYGNDVLENDFDFSKLANDSSNHLVRLSNGKLIKSSSYHLCCDNYDFILGINFDISIITQLHNFSNDFMQTNSDLLSSLQIKKENSLSSLFEEALAIINKPVYLLRKEDRQHLIQILSQKNYFSLSKCIPFLSENLKVSKFTIYKDLNELGLSRPD